MFSDTYHRTGGKKANLPFMAKCRRSVGASLRLERH
jgi:hypothetical protein